MIFFKVSVPLKMKKLLFAILTLSYVFASLSYTSQRIFCQAAITGNALNQCLSKVCDKCGTKYLNNKTNNCCSHESNITRNDKDQNIPEPVFNPNRFVAIALPVFFTGITPGVFTIGLKVIFKDHSPPPRNGVAIFIRNRDFRI